MRDTPFLQGLVFISIYKVLASFKRVPLGLNEIAILKRSLPRNQLNWLNGKTCNVVRQKCNSCGPALPTVPYGTAEWQSPINSLVDKNQTMRRFELSLLKVFASQRLDGLT